MLSIPPVIIISLTPTPIAIAAYTAVFIPDAQTLLIVVAGTDTGIPAPSSAYLAGFWLYFQKINFIIRKNVKSPYSSLTDTTHNHLFNYFWV